MFDSEEQREKVLSQMKEIRDSGETNMMDVMGVKRVAKEEGYTELVNFLGDNPAQSHRKYAKVLSDFEEYVS